MTAVPAGTAATRPAPVAGRSSQRSWAAAEAEAARVPPEHARASAGPAGTAPAVVLVGRDGAAALADVLARLAAVDAERPVLVAPPVPAVPGRRVATTWARRAASRLAPSLAGRRVVVHGLEPDCWVPSTRLARRLGASVLLEVGAPLVGEPQALSPRLRRRLRWTKPVVVVPDEAHADALPPAVPTVLAPGGTRGGGAAAVDAVTIAHRWLARPGGPRFLAVNARYAARPTSGVERVAERTQAHLPVPRAVVAPHGRWASGPLGHLWEQVVLPLRLLPHRSLLWSPCNFGPVLVRRQIVHVHDVAPLEHPEWFSSGYRTWFALVVGRLWRRSAAVAVPAADVARRAARVLGPASGQVAVVPGGVDPAEPPAPVAEPDPAEPPAPAEEPGGPFVLFVGSLEPRKNLGTLVAAMAEVQQRRSDPLPLLVVGPQASTSVFAGGGASDLDAPWVRWLGRVDDEVLDGLLRRASCLAYPSRYEGFGLPPLEAMARGTPVVVSDIAVLHTTCGPAARYVDPGDPSALADALVAAVEAPPDERRRRAHAGRAQAGRFTWRASADALAALAEQVGDHR